MRVELNSSEVTDFIAERVKAGEFLSPEALVESAVKLMMREDVAQTLTDEEIRAIDEAEEQFE